MRTLMICEAASNHNGDIEIAKEMVRTAAKCGADYIKFQSWQSKNLRPDDPDLDRFRKSELSDEDHHVLIEECQKAGISFLTSCFDLNRIDFLSSLGLKEIKVPSPELASYALIKKLKERFERIIVSSGMSYPEEIRKTVEILQGSDLVILHCVSLYPTPIEKVNLARMDWLRQFVDKVGFSDHTLGVEAGKAAIARGAYMLEKHFTLDKEMEGKFQALSADPAEIKELVDYARLAEKLIGSPESEMSSEEKKIRSYYSGKWGDNR